MPEGSGALSAFDEWILALVEETLYATTVLANGTRSDAEIVEGAARMVRRHFVAFGRDIEHAVSVECAAEHAQADQRNEQEIARLSKTLEETERDLAEAQQEIKRLIGVRSYSAYARMKRERDALRHERDVLRRAYRSTP